MVYQTLKPAALLLLLIAFVACTDTGQTLETDHTDRTDPVLLISIDGMMNDYLERNDTPNFDRLIAEGVYPEYLLPVFPTKTFPTHWSIATGLYVENHGIISNSFYDYELEERFSYGPQEEPNNERWWGGEPIWATAEKQGKTAATFFWPGSEASINGVRPTKWMDYDGSVPDSSRIETVMTWLDQQGEIAADFSTLYFSFVDSRGHRYGPNSSEVDEAVVEMDALLGYLFEEMDRYGLTDQLNLIVVSDHGMAELSEDKLIFLDDLINLDDVDMIDWTPVAMIRPDEGKTEEIYNTLKENEENYTVYMREDLPERFRFSNHYRIPEIIMIADMSYSITSHSFFEERGLIAGTHGYDNDTPEMHTFMAASGPAFKSGGRTAPVNAVDIYDLIAYIMKIEPAENDGSLENVRELLR